MTTTDDLAAKITAKEAEMSEIRKTNQWIKQLKTNKKSKKQQQRCDKEDKSSYVALHNERNTNPCSRFVAEPGVDQPNQCPVRQLLVYIIIYTDTELPYRFLKTICQSDYL